MSATSSSNLTVGQPQTYSFPGSHYRLFLLIMIHSCLDRTNNEEKQSWRHLWIVPNAGNAAMGQSMCSLLSSIAAFQWKAGRQLIEVGYRYALVEIEKWKRAGGLHPESP